MPSHTDFVPQSSGTAAQNMSCVPEETVVMTADEYETIRLIDFEELTQEECAEQMDVARTTVQLIYMSARKKVADCLVNGLALKISGGNVRLCEHNKNSQACGCGRSCCHRRCSTKQKGD